MLTPVLHLPEKCREFDPAETVIKTIKPEKHRNDLDLRECELLIKLDEDKNKWHLALSRNY
jgi:hypothetical protein